MKPTEYLVALPFSLLEIGPYNGGSCLHCTLMHWFTLPPGISVSVLKGKLKAVSFDLCKARVELVSVEAALFGPDSNVSVSVLEKDKTLIGLHQNLLQFLHANKCGLPREDWIGDHYRPHVTVNNDLVFAIGQRHTVSRLALIKRTADGAKSVIYQLAW